MSQMKRIAKAEGVKEKQDEGGNRSIRFQDLPTEILSIIIGYLDVRSQLCVWETCTQLKSAMQCSVSLGSLNLRHSQRQPSNLMQFLRNNAVYITNLDMCRARGFTESDAVSALLLMENLSSLDVRHTVVSLTSASVVCAACPRLVRLACNVTNSITASDMASETMRESFRNLKRVYFVVSTKLYCDILEALVLAPNIVECKLAGGKLVNSSYETFVTIFEKARLVLPKLQFFSCIIFPRHEGVMTVPNLAWDHVIVTDVNMWMHCKSGSSKTSRVPVKFKSKIVVSAWPSSLSVRNPNFIRELRCEIKSQGEIVVCDDECRWTVPQDPRVVKGLICPCVFTNQNMGNYPNLHKVGPAINTLSFKLFCFMLNRCKVTTFKLTMDWTKIVEINIMHKSLDMPSYELEKLIKQYFQLMPRCVNLEYVTIYCQLREVELFARHMHLYAGLRNITLKFSDIAATNEVSSLFSGLAICPNLENVHIAGCALLPGIEFVEPYVESFLLTCTNLNTLVLQFYAQDTNEFITDIIRRAVDKLQIKTDFELSVASMKENLVEVDFLESDVLKAHQNIIYD